MLYIKIEKKTNSKLFIKIITAYQMLYIKMMTAYQMLYIKINKKTNKNF